jgi:co-chaperonin GroES (HSP10)
MSVVTGKILPLKDKVMVTNMEFGQEITKGGIILHSDDGKSTGIHPRWAQVYAIGPDQKDVKIGEWILLEHGRWSRGVNYKTDTGEELVLRLADNNAIIMSADEKPNDVYRAVVVGAGSNFNFNIPGA